MHPWDGNPEIRRAFEHCTAVARSHYENFPVASLMLPAERRPYVAAIYAFARAADDMADEGSHPPEERLRLLEEWEAHLERSYQGRASHPVFLALGATAERFAIPRSLFTDLLEAFRADALQRRYPSFDDLLGYCRRSANPIGRLVLAVFEDTRERSAMLSDEICTGLQLANFWQDLSVDIARGRLYLPLDDLEAFGYTEAEIAQRRPEPRFGPLLALQLGRARERFNRGAPLIGEAIPPLRMEISLTWRGGMAILDRVEQAGPEVLRRRPVLSPVRKMLILIPALVRFRR